MEMDMVDRIQWVRELVAGGERSCDGHFWVAVLFIINEDIARRFIKQVL